MKKFLLLFLSITVLSVSFAYAQDVSAFNAYFQSAKGMYDRGQYESAKRVIAKAREGVVGITPAMISKLNALAKSCDDAIAFRDHLTVSPDSLAVPFSGAKNTIVVSAGQPEKLAVASDDPTWCHPQLVGKDSVVVTTDFNPNKQERSSIVMISMGKVRSRTVSVRQDARPETRKKLNINTVPARTKIYIDGDAKNSPFSSEFSSGEHRIIVEKNDYYKKDTTVVIADDLSTDDMNILIRLKPRFGTVKVGVRPEAGYESFFKKASITINGRLVEYPGSVYTFDDDRDVQIYKFYENDVIPVPVSSGPVEIVVSSEGFYKGSARFRLSEGEHIDTTINITPITGTFSLVDSGNAAEAAVTLDGKEIGLVRDMTDFRTSVGRHIVKISRQGHLPREDAYAFDVEENNNTIVVVSMRRFNVYRFESVPEKASVSLNGNDLGITTPSAPVMITEVPNIDYVFNFHKENYRSVDRVLSEEEKDFSRLDTILVRESLIRTYPLTVSADEDSLRMWVWEGRKAAKAGMEPVCEGVKIPSTVHLPLQPKPYWVELRKYDGGTVLYKGSMKFSSENKKVHNIQSWSVPSFHLLTMNIPLAGQKPLEMGGFGTDPKTAAYRKFGDLSILNFRTLYIPGLSTSLAKFCLFSASGKQTMSIPKTASSTDVINMDAPMVLPAVSLLMINQEFRMGVTFLEHVDVAAMGAYTWYPDMFVKLANFSHMTGHEMFFGGELSSRMSSINFNLKAGMQIFANAKANIYGKPQDSTSSNDNAYHVLDMNIPNMFVVSVGFTFGDRSESKGNNLLRLYCF